MNSFAKLVATRHSPPTQRKQIEVSQEIFEMFGFKVDTTPTNDDNDNNSNIVKTSQDDATTASISSRDSSTIGEEEDDEEEVVQTIQKDELFRLNANRAKIRFGRVEIREYERIVGDHPDVEAGTPLAIGWNYEEATKPHPSVDRYEQTREPNRKTKTYQLRLTSITRTNMMRQILGLTAEELEKAEREAARVSIVRNEEGQQHLKPRGFKRVFRSARKGLKKRLSLDQFTAVALPMMPVMSR